MVVCSKQDWKLFREKIGDWQEAYMEKLVLQYMELLSSDALASDKFWELEKRLKKDQKHPGVILELQKSEVAWDLVRLIKEHVITIDDIKEFSDEMQETVWNLLGRSRG